MRRKLVFGVLVLLFLCVVVSLVTRKPAEETVPVAATGTSVPAKALPTDTPAPLTNTPIPAPTPTPVLPADTPTTLPTNTPAPTDTPMLPTDTPAPTSTPAPTNTPAPPTNTPVPPTATPAPTWHEVARWEGKSIKNTETFHIPSHEWRISWDTKPGEYGEMNFQIFVYNATGDVVGVAANVIGADKDSSIMRGVGDYYLMINTAQPYTVIIEVKY